MTRKEILIIFLIICCLFSLQAVAAASDGNSTDAVVLTTDGNVSAYSLPNTENQLRDGSEAGTFSDLQNDLSPGGDIVLTKNYTYNSDVDDGLANGISVPNTVNSISGSGKIVIDASQQARIFNIHSDHSVTLTGITFINANADGNGGSINSDGTLIISNCNFTNNTASGHGGAVYLGSSDGDTITDCYFEGNVAGRNGGAIDWYAGSSDGEIIGSTFTKNTAKRSGGAVHWSGHYGTIKDSNFTDNIATGEVIDEIGGIIGGGDGGAVLWVGSNGTIDNCIFIDNSAQNRGGAIFLHGNSTENCTNTTFRYCNFTDNEAGMNGGAIDWQEGAHDGNVIYCDFTSNKAGSNGGAIFWSGHHGEIHHSNFTNNIAKGTVTDTHGNYGDGGAVIWSGINGTVTYCRFINNTADQRGGGVYLQNCTYGNCDNTTFSHSIFINNTAGLNGGAIDWHAGASHGNVSYCDFENNIANRSAGAIYWSGYNGTITHSNFTSNKALGIALGPMPNGTMTYGGDAGAVMWTGALGIVDDCRFINNSATQRGGAVFLQAGLTKEGTVENCENTTFIYSTFIDNVAGMNGGAIDWHAGSRNGNVSYCTFENNVANRSAGAIYWSGFNGTIIHSNFTSNKALGIALGPMPNGTMTYGGDAGAVMWTGAVGTVDDCIFVDNSATQRGGAVFLQAGLTAGGTVENCENTTFINSVFRDNVAGLNGGAIEWLKGARNGVVDNVTFINNTARRSGGAIFWNGINGTVKNSRFDNNRATGETLQYDMDLTMDNVVIVNESELPSNLEQGKLYVLNYTKDGVRVFESYVVGENDEIIKLDETTTVSQTISPQDWAIDQFFGGDGGTILWSGDIGAVDNCTFVNSNSARRGGAAYMTGSSNVTYSNNNFTNCTSGTNGGGVDWLAGARYGKIINCTFNETRAARSAGAIYYDGWYGEMVNITIINTKAWGGTLKESGDGLVKYAGWDSSHWDTNTTGGDAGAIMITGSYETLYNITFINCTATGRGGAIFMQDNHDVTIDLCRFEDNQALGTAYNTYNNPRDTSSGHNEWKTGHGGAIGFDLGASKGTIKNSIFINNTAARDGGAISFAYGSSYATIYNSSFINNTAKRSGGAFSWDGSEGNISYCNFTGNKALGTAIDTDHINFTSLSQVHEVTTLPELYPSVTNKLYVLVTYEGKTKTKYELYVAVPDPIEEYVWIKHTETDSTDPSATDWATDEYFGGDGGSIIWGGDHGIVDHCIFIDSDSARRGGGAYMQGSDNVTFSNCYFENSTSGTNGGGLDWLAGANYGKVINCTFNNTRAARSAGAIYYDGDYGEMTNITIINATSFGGALKESRDHKVKYAGWDASHWDTNTTGGDAGAIMFTGDNIYVYNATFTNCTSAGRGGAVFLQDNENVTFELCLFEENSALGIANNTWKNFREERNDANANTKVDYTLTGHGGAIAFDVGASDGYVIDSTFIDNHAHRDGGAIYYAAGATRGIVINSTFINHTINYDGGAIYLNGTYCEIHNSTFLNNSAKDDGGAIFWQGDHGIIYNITCDLNHGIGTGAGGGSSTKGGVICLTGSDVSVDKSTFTNSYGGLLGGSIFVTGDNVNITNSVFKNSTIGISDGGALYILGDDTLIKNCTFDNCTSPSEGGTIYVSGDRVILEDSTITNSTAINGGAIYIKGNEAAITNTQISQVNASVYGGAIYVEGDNAAISVNITDTSVSGMDNYVPHVDSDYYNDHIADMLNKTDEMIGFVGTINCEHISQQDITRLKSKLQDIRKAIENVTTANGRINSTNVTVALGLLDELNETLKQINATLTLAEYKENTLALFSYVGDVESELKSLAIIDASLVIPENILDDINSMISNLDTLESKGVPIESVLELNNTLQSIKDDAENIFLGNKFNLAAINLTSSLLAELNQTLTEINATLSNNALDELFKGVEDTNKELNNLTDIIMENVVIPKAYGSGGAVYISGDGDVITDSHISQTSAYYGGAVYISGNDAAIENSDFKDINATEDGGALYISGDGGRLYNSNFTHNLAGDDGGAIYWSGDHGTIKNVVCDDNHGISFNESSSRGGAICLTGNDVKISKSKFNYNNITYSDGSNLSKIDGGALFITGNDVTVSDTEFSHNNASHYGGTIYVLGNETVIDNCTIDSSLAIRGGAIYVEGENATISAKFKNTNATLSGGAIYVHGENTTIVNSSFDTTYAFGSVDNGGGAIMVNGNYTSIEKSNFTNTHADINYEARGGAIYIKGICTNITDSDFDHSRSNLYGGSIYINGTNTTIRGSNFTDCAVNSDGSQGGAIYVNGEYTTIIESAFDKNTAKEEGGAIYIHGVKTTISNSTFEENSVNGNGGGAIYVNGDNATIEGSNFTKNEANVKNGAKGGAIYVEGKYTLIDGSNFADSLAKFRGGAIYIDGANAKVKDSNFTDSSITGGKYGNDNPRGGAIYIKADYASVEGSIFNHSAVSNTVGEGGAIFIEGKYANILASEFESSTANCGGAMYSTGSYSLVYNSNFTNNLVELNGGAIYWYGGSNSQYNTVDGCIFTNNTAYANTTSPDATRGGGAIYWSENGKYGTVKNSKFYYNSVQSANDKKVDGGAILWDKSYHALVDHCDFVGNFVTTNGDKKDDQSTGIWAQGGAMYLRPYNNYTVRNCEFVNCSSSKEAGALYIQVQGGGGSGRKVLLENSRFINNVAHANGDYNINGGGAIQVKQSSDVQFKNLTFINNTANQGGAISVAKSVSSFTITGANFTLNKADMGSAIYTICSFTLTDAVLLKNRANTSSLDLTLSRPTNNIDITLKGWDNRLNALYVASGSVTCTDVTYWTDNNKTIGEEAITTSSQSSVSGPTLEKGISITVELFNRYNEKLSEGIFATDAYGEIHLAPADFAGVTSFNEVYVVARLTNEDYYTQVQNTTRLPTEMQATAHNVTYHRNATVNVTMAPSSESEGNATGIISVYYNDTFLGNITLADNNKGISDEISTLLGDRYLEVGKHNLTLRYWGDLYNDAVNLTVPINVTKAQSNITIIYEDMGYDLWVNVTIVDDYDDVYYKDATGNVILEVYSIVSADPLKTVTVGLINGTALARIENLLPSNYTIKARYGGDHNYYDSVNSTPAEVREKADAIVDIQVSAFDIMVDETVYINITLITPPEYKATGNVTLYLDNEKYILPLNNSKAYFNKTGMPEGVKIITVCYDGNEQLIPTSNDATFRVHKYNTTISVNTTNITHIQHEVINITLLNDTVGVISVFVDGEEYFVRINNGTAIVELPLLPVGDYNVTVIFPGDDKYNNNTAYANFSVLPATPDIIIDVENVTYGNSTPVVVTLINCAEGTVSIEIDGVPYGDAKLLDNGRVEFNVSDLAAGNHKVKAIYSGDANHTAVNGEQKFTVYKANRTVLVDVQDIVYGDAENIKVYVNATGNVTIKINGRTIEEYKVLEDNSTQITVANLAAGNYNVEVIYNGNENYTQSKATAAFTVSQMDTSLDIQVHDLLVWNKEYINITVRNSTGDVATNLNGTLTINIDGVDHSARIIKGIAQFNIVENSVGDRVVWVFFEGDNNFKPSKAMDTYKVKQRTPSMEVIAQDILVGEDGNITVKLPANATGYVEVRVVGDNTYYSHLTNGIAVIHPKNLNEGEYTVNIRYHGTEHDNYTAVSHRSSFTVSKAKVNLTIDVNDTVYGNASDIVVYVDDGVEGSITIRINDTLIGTYGIVGGKVNTTVSLAAGTYTVHAEYNGNYRYAENKTESKDFTVAKATPAITIDTPQVVNAATNATIIVRINETATGNITITVNGTKYNATIENGFAVFTINQLLAGQYDITAEYGGDGNYSAVDSVTLVKGLTVTKVACYQINVTANDTLVDVETTIVVKVPRDAKGNVSIYIDGVFEKNATINDGIAELNVTGLYGNHTVNVTFTDDKYGPRYAICDFWVFKHESPLEIAADSIVVGDVAYINVTAPSDNVTIEINGKSYSSDKFENGIAYFTVSGLEHGDKTVVAIYGGSEKYVRNTTTGKFTVDKRSSQVNVTVQNITVGEVADIVVKVPSDAKGYVVVVVDGVNYTANLTDGIGHVHIKDLANTTYNVNVTYIGDEKYLSSTNSTKLAVGKNNTTLTIAADTINYGETAVINVTVAPNDATGFITVTLSNGKSVTLPVVEGKVQWNVSGLAAGTYTISANYSGDGKYNLNNSNKIIGELEVTPIAPEMSVVKVISEAGKNATVIVRIDSRVSDNVTVTVDGKPYSVKPNADGVAIVTTDILENGTHTLAVSYAGDNNFTEATSDQPNFVTNKTSDYVMNITAYDIKYGNATNITVNVPVDAKGIVIVNINGTNYTATITDGKAVFNENIRLAEGRYNITAYFGNKKYENKTATGTFYVSKVETPIRIDVDDIKVGDKASITVTVPKDVAEKVTIEIDGVKYEKAVDSDGKAKFEVQLLTNGTRTVVATYYGDDKYAFNSTTANFTVTKRNSYVNVTVENINVTEVADIVVKVPANATGYVVVVVDGVNYTANLTDGVGHVHIKGLANGTYNVTATYIGDEQYSLSVNDTQTFTVSKVKSAINMTVSHDGIIANGTDVNITIHAPADATGKVNITIHDDVKQITYVIYVNDGVGVLHLESPEIGIYNVTAKYLGDGKYLGSENETKFEVYITGKSLSVETEDVTVAQHETIKVWASGNHEGKQVKIIVTDSEGNVRVDENATFIQYNAETNMTYAELPLDLLPAGDYAVEAFYLEINGTKRVEHNGTGKFTVSKLPSTLTIKEIENITVGGNVTIKLEIDPQAATGNVSVFVNGVEHNLNTSNLTLIIPGLAADEYIVHAVYFGNHDYYESNATAAFKVSKNAAPIAIIVTNSKVGDVEQINVTLPKNVTGRVLLDIGGNHYYANVTDGVAVFNITKLDAGKYNVTATYEGDYKYFDNSTNSSFIVSKYQPAFVVNGTNITAGASEFITFETQYNVTGIVKVEINDKNYTAFVNEGKGNLTVCGLEAGDYNVTVYFEGNYKYLPAASAKNKFTVNQTTAEIVIIPQNITYGETETIIIYVNATGKVNVTVVNRDVEDYKVTDEPIVDGKVTIVVPRYLTAGNYTVKVDYSGNVNVSNASAQEDFEVAKADPIMTVSVQNITYGDVEHIRATVNAEGNITIKVNGKETTIVLENGNLVIGVLSARVNQIAQFDGKAGVDVSGLEVGEYPVEVTFNGNENYNKLTINTKFLVTKDNVTVSVQVEDIRTDGKEVINVTLSNTNVTGNVTINVDGINYTRPIKDGKANLTLDKLSNATHSVVVIYEGDRNFNGNWTSDTFNVTKVEPEISVDVANKKVGETERIVVHLPDNATGYVVIDVDGTQYHVDIVAGQEIAIEIDNLENKTYDVNVYYSGDGYWQSTTSSDSFNVSKVKSSINITVIHDGIIPNGTDVDIFIKAPGDITGKVNVTVWDTERDENTTYTVYVNEGNGTLHIETPLDGIYKVNATYLENGKYIGSENYTSFDVYNTRKTLYINSGDVYVDETRTVFVTVPGNHVGEYLTVIISNASGEIMRNETVLINEYLPGPVNASYAQWVLPRLDAGHYDIKAIYIEHDGDKVYAYEGNNDFNVWKLASEIKIKEIKNITVGDNATIELEIELDPNANDGNISVFVNGMEYMTNTSTLKVIVPGLGADNYTVEAIYHGNRWYNESSATSAFKVEKNPAPISITVTNSKVGEIEQINVTLSENITGRVLLDIGDNHYYANITDGVAIFNITKLDAGKYNVTATYDGNYKYFANSTNSTLEITKWDSFVNVTADNITYGDKAVILVETPKDLCGNVTVSVDGENYTVFVSGGHGTLVVPGLNVGPHDVNVTFDGCNKYEPSNNNTIFNVNKVDLNEVDMKVIDYGNGTAVVVLPGNATGNVTIKIDDKEFYAKVVNGTAVVQLDNVTPGTHVAEVIYSGDDKYNATTKMANITAPKYESPINITVGEIVAGENGTIIVSVLENATGNVTVSVGGKQYYGEIKDGVAVVEVGNLTAGPKTFVVEYSGDDNYKANYTVGNFTVDPAMVTPDMTVVDYGNGTVVVVVPEDAVGNVTITVDGKNYTAEVVNGTAVVQLDNVTPGTHEVEVIYSGDDKYNSTVKTTDITAPKYDSPINITVGEIVSGENGTITVTLPENATGNVTVSIGGKQYSGEVIDGIAVVEVGNLTAGPTTFVVEYSGDDNYRTNYTVGNFTVDPAMVTPDMTVVDYGNGTVVVVVPEDAAGNVTITVDGKNYTAEVVNGTAVVQLDNVTPGTHVAEVIYSGDDKYNSTVKTTNITAPKYDSPINITVGEIVSGENGTITVALPENATGNVTVSVDGKEYSAKVINGTAVVEVDNLTAGPKTIVVEYSGDDNYDSAYKVGNFTVEPAKVIPDVTVVDQGNGTIVVVVPEDAAGNITVTVDGKEYEVEVVNGTAVVQLENVTPGTHEIEVKYSGDDKYNSTVKTTNVTAPKYDSPIDIEIGEIIAGENGTIVVKLPENATGNVTVSVDGKQYTAEVINGTATVKVDNLTAGPKTIAVEYSGDDNYDSAYKIGNFTVDQAKVTPDITVVDQGNGTVVVVVPSDATGNVTVTVDGKNYTAEIVNGTAVVQLDNVTPGAHEIEVIYGGDDKYANATANAKVTAPKLDTPITVEAPESKVGDKAIVTVTVPYDATGNVTIEIDGVKYTSQIKNGKAVFEVENLAAGTKTIAVEYAGDDNYIANHTTGTTTVSKCPSTVSATITDIDVGENVTITVTVPEDATGQVLIDIDGVGYYVNVTGGVGTASIPRMPNGIYNVSLTYTGDDKYLSSSNNASFNVSKVESFVIPTIQDITVGEIEVIRLTVPEDATGTVTVVIDGVEYDFNLDDGILSKPSSDDIYSVAVSGGKGVLVISGLPKGEYVVSARYNGDSKYLPSTNTTTFIVSTQAADIDIEDLGNGTIIVHAPKDATGTVTVTVDGEKYTADVVNGTAVINLDKTTPGTKNVEVAYSGDDNYAPETVNSTVSIPKYPTPISVEADDINVGDTAVITVTVPNDAKGIVTIEIDGNQYNADVVDGKAIFKVNGLKEGDKTVAVRFDGGDYYEWNSTTASFTVSKVPSTIKATAKDITAGSDEVITVTVPKDATGQVLVDIDGVGYYGEIINGKAKVIIPKLPAGKYTAKVSYDGDDKYLPTKTTVKFTVNKAKAPVSATGDSVIIGEDASIVVKLPNDATGTVTITVEGKRYTASVINGEARFKVPGLSEGDHKVKVHYSGDENYDANDTVTNVVIEDSTPDNNESADDTPSGKEISKINKGSSLSDYPTGNPLLILLLVLLAVGTTQIRRFRK